MISRVTHDCSGTEYDHPAVRDHRPQLVGTDLVQFHLNSTPISFELISIIPIQTPSFLPPITSHPMQHRVHHATQSSSTDKFFCICWKLQTCGLLPSIPRLFMLFNHIVFTPFRVRQRLIPLCLQPSRLDALAHHPLPKDDNFTTFSLPPPLPLGTIF